MKYLPNEIKIARQRKMARDSSLQLAVKYLAKEINYNDHGHCALLDSSFIVAIHDKDFWHWQYV